MHFECVGASACVLQVERGKQAALPKANRELEGPRPAPRTGLPPSGPPGLQRGLVLESHALQDRTLQTVKCGAPAGLTSDSQFVF